MHKYEVNMRCAYNMGMEWNSKLNIYSQSTFMS